MKTLFQWKKKPFSKTYKIYHKDQLIGRLTDRPFSLSTEGAFSEGRLLFKSSGFFKQKTTLIHNPDRRVIGHLFYHRWKRTATLTLVDRTLDWQYDDFWNTRWRMTDTEGKTLQYKGTPASGWIQSPTEDPLLLLTGLYVAHYHRKRTAAVVFIALIPIWVTLLG